MQRIVVICVATAISSVMPLFLTGALATEIRAEFGGSTVWLGAAATAFFVAAALTSARLGRNADHVGWRRSAIIASVAVSLVLLTISTLVTSWHALIVLLACGGVVHALADPTCNLAIAREVKTDRRAFVFGLKQAATSGAALVAGLSLPIVALTVGWRWAFAGAAVVPLIAAAAATGTSEGTWDPARAVPPGPLQRRPVTYLAVGGGFASAVVSVLSAFLVVSAVAMGASPSQAGFMLAIGSGTGLAVRVAAGWLAGKYGSSGLRPVSVLLMIGAAGFLLLATGNMRWLVPATLMAFGAGWGWNGLFHFAIVAHNPTAPGAAMGLVRTGISIGCAIGPLGFGLIVERTSFAVGWSIIAALALVAATFIAGARGVFERAAVPIGPPEV